MPRDWREIPALQSDKEPFTRPEVWIWILEKAVWAPCHLDVRGRTTTLERGQLCFAFRKLGELWKWDEAKVRRFLNRLQDDGLITVCADVGRSVITVCNYEAYKTTNRRHDAGDAAQPDGDPPAQRRKRDAQKKEENQSNEYKKEEEPSALVLDKGWDDVESVPDKAVGGLASARGEPAKAARLWNSLAARHGLSVVRTLSDTRKRHLRCRLRECGGIGGWKLVLDKVEESRFLLGENDSGWQVDLDFLLKPEKFAKLMEDRYSRSVSPRGSARERTASDLWKRSQAVDAWRARQREQAAVLEDGA